MEELKSKIANRNNRIIFLVLNLILNLCIFFNNATFIGGCIVAVLNLILFLIVLLDDRSDQYATLDLGLFFLIDLLILIGVNANDLILYHKNYWFAQFNFDASTTIWLVIIGAIGICMFFFGICSVVNPIGASIILGVVIYREYGYISAPYLSNLSLLILILSLILYWLWFFISLLMKTISEYSSSSIKWISGGLIGIQVFFLIFENDFVIVNIQTILSFITKTNQSFLPWWNLVIIELIVIGGVFGVLRTDKEEKNIDVMILMSIGFFPILIKVLTKLYFTYNAVLVFAFCVMLYECIKHEVKSEKTLGCNNVPLLMASMASIPVIASLIKHNLLVGIVVVAFVSIAVYRFRFNGKSLENQPTAFWVYILCSILFEAMAFIVTKKYSVSNITILCIVFAFSLAALCVIDWPHPNKIASPMYVKLLICVCFAIMCIVPAVRFGTSVKIAEKPGTDARVTISNSVYDKSIKNSVSYFWENQRFDRVCETRYLTESNSDLQVEAEILMVSATDVNGVTTRYRYWYPYVFTNFLRNIVDEVDDTREKFKNYLSENYSVDVMSTDISEDSLMTVTVPTYGKACTVNYDIVDSVSDKGHIKVSVVNKYNRDCSQYFDIIVDEDKKQIEFILNKVPNENIFKFIIEDISDSGEIICRATLDIVAGSREEIIVINKNFDLKDGKYTIQNNDTGLFICHDAAKESVVVKEEGVAWTLKKSGNSLYSISKTNKDQEVYMFGVSSYVPSVYPSTQPFAAWQISECWIPGTGRAVALAVNMKNVKKLYGVENSIGNGGTYYLIQYDDNIGLAKRGDLDKSCLWSLVKQKS